MHKHTQKTWWTRGGTQRRCCLQSCIPSAQPTTVKNPINSFFFQPINLNTYTFKTQEVLVHPCSQWTDQFSTSAYKLFHFPPYKQDPPPLHQPCILHSSPPQTTCLFVCASICDRERMKVFSGEMSSSDYRLRQFSNYSVNHQSCGLMWAILWSDGQCNHHWRSPPPPYTSACFTLLCVSPHFSQSPLHADALHAFVSKTTISDLFQAYLFVKNYFTLNLRKRKKTLTITGLLKLDRGL